MACFFKKVDANLGDPEWRVRVVILALVVEPLRFLCSHFMKCSFADIAKPCNTFSPAMNLINPSASLVIAALQYWSDLLAFPANHPRLLLAATQRRCSSFEEWRGRHPADMDILRKAILVVSAQVWRRVYVRSKEQLGVFRLADMRLGEDAREAQSQHQP